MRVHQAYGTCRAACKDGRCCARYGARKAATCITNASAARFSLPPAPAAAAAATAARGRASPVHKPHALTLPLELRRATWDARMHCFVLLPEANKGALSASWVCQNGSPHATEKHANVTVRVRRQAWRTRLGLPAHARATPARSAGRGPLRATAHTMSTSSSTTLHT